MFKGFIQYHSIKFFIYKAFLYGVVKQFGTLSDPNFCREEMDFNIY